MNIFAFNPRTASLVVANYVLPVLDAEIAGTVLSQKAVKERADALLDVFSKSPPQSVEDIQLLFASANALGYQDGRVEFLASVRRQFYSGLPYEVRKQLEVQTA